MSTTIHSDLAAASQAGQTAPEPGAAVVEPGAFLTLHYRLAGPTGDIINTFDGKPATLSLGTGKLSPRSRHA